jgi:hypothetical protein
MDWGLATSTRAGESASGDRCIVRPLPAGALIAVVDGAGHGPEAARAAERTAAILERTAGLPLAEVLALCHQGLVGTRGAVALAAHFDAADGTLAWAGVGDVLGVLVRADAHIRPNLEVLFPREGILGMSMPPLPRSLLALRDRDLLVLATDGVRDGFVRDAQPGNDPHQVAARILELHGKVTDDALVLAVRFRAEPR